MWESLVVWAVEKKRKEETTLDVESTLRTFLPFSEKNTEGNEAKTKKEKKRKIFRQPCPFFGPSHIVDWGREKRYIGNACREGAGKGRKGRVGFPPSLFGPLMRREKREKA